MDDDGAGQRRVKSFTSRSLVQILVVLTDSHGKLMLFSSSREISLWSQSNSGQTRIQVSQGALAIGGASSCPSWASALPGAALLWQWLYLHGRPVKPPLGETSPWPCPFHLRPRPFHLLPRCQPELPSSRLSALLQLGRSPTPAGLTRCRPQPQIT